MTREAITGRSASHVRKDNDYRDRISQREVKRRAEDQEGSRDFSKEVQGGELWQSPSLAYKLHGKGKGGLAYYCQGKVWDYCGIAEGHSGKRWSNAGNSRG